MSIPDALHCSLSSVIDSFDIIETHSIIKRAPVDVEVVQLKISPGDLSAKNIINLNSYTGRGILVLSRRDNLQR